MLSLGYASTSIHRLPLAIWTIHCLPANRTVCTRACLDRNIRVLSTRRRRYSLELIFVGILPCPLKGTLECKGLAIRMFGVHLRVCANEFCKHALENLFSRFRLLRLFCRLFRSDNRGPAVLCCGTYEVRNGWSGYL